MKAPTHGGIANCDIVSNFERCDIQIGSAEKNMNLIYEFIIPAFAVADAFSEEHCEPGFSERDFTAVMRGLMEKKFIPSPGTAMKANKKR